MGRITKGRQCSVKLCENEANRSLSLLQVSNYLDLKVEKRISRVFLCKEHYKEYKKKSKKDKKTEKLRYGGGRNTGKRGGFKGPMS